MLRWYQRSAPFVPGGESPRATVPRTTPGRPARAPLPWGGVLGPSLLLGLMLAACGETLPNNPGGAGGPDSGVGPADTGANADTGAGADDAGATTADSGFHWPDTGLHWPDGGLEWPDTGLHWPDGGLHWPDANGGAANCSGAAPPDAPIQIEDSCPAFAACGGDPTGSWNYSGGCVRNPFSQLGTLCRGATVGALVGRVNDCISFDGTTLTRHATWVVSTTATAPAICAPLGCAALQVSVRGIYPNANCRDNPGGGCACDLSVERNIDDSARYTVNGNVLEVGLRRFDFCANGDALGYSETGIAPAEPGNFQLQRR